MSETLEFAKLCIAAGDLDAVPKPQVAAFSISCHAINELNVLRRVYLCIDHQEELCEVAQIADITQRFVFIRIINAKLFEFSEFAMLKGKYNRTENKVLATLSEAASKSFEKLKSHPGYELAKAIRHEATNHYHLSPAIKNLEHLNGNHVCDMFLHKLDGNSFFPLGEEVVFGAGLKRAISEEAVLADSALECWLDWGLLAMDWAKDIHMDIFEHAIMPHLEPRLAENIKVPIPDDFYQCREKSVVPLFLKVNEAP